MTDGYEETETETQAAKAGNDKTKITIGEMFSSLFQNPPLMVLMLADLAKWCVKFVTAASAIYYFRDAMGNPGPDDNLSSQCGSRCYYRSVFHEIYCESNFFTDDYDYCVCGNGSVFVPCIYILRKCDGRNCTYDAGSVLLWNGICSISVHPYADTVVYATWKSGKDASGWIMGLQNLPLKIAVFLRGTILSACLVAVGWQSGVVLEGTARQGMTISFALVPAIFCLVGMLLLIFGFKITKEKVIQYQAEIDARS